MFGEAAAGIKLSREHNKDTDQTARINNNVIRLGGCVGRSMCLLIIYGINRFSHDMAHL